MRQLSGAAQTRVGGGVRSVERAKSVLDQGASRVIVGTAAFRSDGVDEAFLGELRDTVGAERVLLALDSKGGRIVVKGWQEALSLTAEQVLRQLEPYCGGFLCTYVDKEGMLDGTDLDWYRSLRDATRHEITAAGGITTLDEIEALNELGIHSALGMAVYTGRLDLDELAKLNQKLSAGL